MTFRRKLQRIWGLALLVGSSVFNSAHGAENLIPIEVSFPGPGNLSYLPIELIPAIGADRELGVQLLIRHTGGGGLALQNLASHNVSFAIAGMPAVMSEAVTRGSVVAIASVDDSPLFVLMVRQALRGKVKRLGDLRGRVVGVNSSSLTSKTTSQQLAELLLRSDGVKTHEFRVMPAGQSWDEQSSVITSGVVDAIVGDEPFATRLLEEKKVFFLANLTDPAISKKIRGSGFLHAALVTRPELLQKNPEKADLMIKLLKKSLAWIATHSPEEVAARLMPQDAEARASIIKTLKKYPHLYSADGSFSSKQLKDTELFFRMAFPEEPKAQNLSIETLVDDRRVGRRS